MSRLAADLSANTYYWKRRTTREVAQSFPHSCLNHAELEIRAGPGLSLTFDRLAIITPSLLFYEDDPNTKYYVLWSKQ